MKQEALTLRIGRGEKDADGKVQYEHEFGISARDAQDWSDLLVITGQSVPVAMKIFNIGWRLEVGKVAKERYLEIWNATKDVNKAVRAAQAVADNHVPVLERERGEKTPLTPEEAQRRFIRKHHPDWSPERIEQALAQVMKVLQI